MIKLMIVPSGKRHLYIFINIEICLTHYIYVYEYKIHKNLLLALLFTHFLIFLLLFADDTVLFSYTKEGLQSLLYKLHRYCDKWGISANLDKTVEMVCKKSRNVENVELIYDNHVLKQVNKFTYLGVT